LDWLGVQALFITPYRTMKLPPGRGFFVSKGKPQLVQTPRAEKLIPVQKAQV
jgi:hypothetical protein